MKIQRIWRGKIERSYSYFEALEIDRYPRMYILEPELLKELFFKMTQADLGDFKMCDLKD